MHSFRNMYALFLVLGFAVASPIARNDPLDLVKSGVNLNSVDLAPGVGYATDNTEGGQMKGGLGRILGIGMTDNKDSGKLTTDLNGDNVDGQSDNNGEHRHTLVSSEKHKSEGSTSKSENVINLPDANGVFFSDSTKAKSLGNVDANNKGLAVDDVKKEHLQDLGVIPDSRKPESLDANNKDLAVDEHLQRLGVIPDSRKTGNVNANEHL